MNLLKLMPKLPQFLFQQFFAHSSGKKFRVVKQNGAKEYHQPWEGLGGGGDGHRKSSQSRLSLRAAKFWFEAAIFCSLQTPDAAQSVCIAAYISHTD